MLQLRLLSSTLAPLASASTMQRLPNPHAVTLGVVRNFSAGFNSSKYNLLPEQVALVEAAEDFAEKELKPHAAKWDAEKVFPVETLRKAAGLGFAGMFVGERYGGTGLTRSDGICVYEALATADPSTAAYISIHNMVAWMIDEFGNEDQKKRFLPRLTSMEWFSSYCLTEPNAGSDAASLRTSAKFDASTKEWVLNGSKAFISGGSRSDLYLVMARTGGEGPKGISCFAVEAGKTPGMTFGAQERKLGWNSQPTCAVSFDDARIPESNLVGELGQGFKYAMKGLDGGRIAIASCSVGAAKACFDVARAHVKVREQFGKPLAANQTVQFRLADVAGNIHASRLLIRNAAKLLDDKDPSATVFCAMAKKMATDMCFQACDDSLQLLGGYGYLKDYPIERYLRDARVHRILEGTNEIQQMLMSRAALADD